MSEHDDFEIVLGRSVSRRFEDKPSPLQDRLQCAFPYDRPESDPVPVFFAAEVVRAIEAHAKANVEIEVGGVLLGAFYSGDKGSFIEVTDFIEAAAAKSTGVSLTFTHETWEIIHAEQARRGPGLMIVGWYHTHPGLGVFLSNEDEFIHTSYFTDPWQVALVVDPVYDNWGCFKWTDRNLVQTGGFYVFGARKEAKQVRDYTVKLEGSRQRTPAGVTAAGRAGGSRSSRSLWVAILALMIIDAFTAWMLIGRSTPAPKSDNYAAAIRLLGASDLTGAEQMLRLHLLSNPCDDQALRELQRLDSITSRPGISSPSLDRVNFLLERADALAERKQNVDKPGILDSLSPEPNLKLYAADPTQLALQVYKPAASSHAARLARAIAIQKAGDQLTAPIHVRNAWWDKAVEWIRQEHIREIAYGTHAASRKYEAQYDKLSAADKAAVNKIRSRIGKTK